MIASEHRSDPIYSGRSSGVSDPSSELTDEGFGERAVSLPKYQSLEGQSQDDCRDTSVIHCLDMGCVPYREALVWQQELSQKRRGGEVPDYLLLLEHPPVFTTGRRDASSDLLRSEQWLKRQGIDFIKTDRGGLITYHGPGQLVGYLIFQLRDSTPKLVWRIEESLLRTLSCFSLEGSRDAQHPGIWIEDRKIASVGLRIEKGVTRHGFSLNVHCDLTPFQYIHPCGIQDRGVTSLKKELGWCPPMHEIKTKLIKEWSQVFEREITVVGTTSLPGLDLPDGL